MSNEKAFGGDGENQMKKSLTLLVLATALGIVAMGCEPAPKDEPATTATSDSKGTMPHANAPASAAPKSDVKTAQ